MNLTFDDAVVSVLLEESSRARLDWEPECEDPTWEELGWKEEIWGEVGCVCWEGSGWEDWEERSWELCEDSDWEEEFELWEEECELWEEEFELWEEEDWCFLDLLCDKNADLFL